jgi:hypothetical protein
MTDNDKKHQESDQVVCDCVVRFTPSISSAWWLEGFVAFRLIFFAFWVVRLCYAVQWNLVPSSERRMEKKQEAYDCVTVSTSTKTNQT